MSRPGYPVSMSQTVTVHSNYHERATGNDYPGSDECFIRAFFDDKIGANSPGYPANQPENDYTRASYSWNQSPLSVHGTKMPEGDTFDGNWGNLFGLGYNPVSDNENFSLGQNENDVNNRLTMKMISQLQSNKVNLGEIFHTRQQAANLVGSTCSRIGSAFKQLRAGNFAGMVRSLGGTGRAGAPQGSGSLTQTLGGVPEQWLAAKYGWQPLLQDVYNSLDSVRQAYSDSGQVHRVEASFTSTAPNKSIKRSAGGDWGPEIEYNCTGRRVSGRAFIEYAITGGFAHSLSQFGILNPAALAWELLPYSFVVDWALPIGPYLSSLDYAVGLSFVKGSRTFHHRQTWNSRLTRTKGTMPGGYSADWSGGTGSGSGFLMRREVYPNFPFPPLPQIKDPFSPVHMANGISLLVGAFGRNQELVSYY